eukprot:941673-Prymnesium_polylepis.1
MRSPHSGTAHSDAPCEKRLSARAPHGVPRLAMSLASALAVRVCGVEPTKGEGAVLEAGRVRLLSARSMFGMRLRDTRGSLPLPATAAGRGMSGDADGARSRVVGVAPVVLRE